MRKISTYRRYKYKLSLTSEMATQSRDISESQKIQIEEKFRMKHWNPCFKLGFQDRTPERIFDQISFGYGNLKKLWIEWTFPKTPSHFCIFLFHSNGLLSFVKQRKNSMNILLCRYAALRLKKYWSLCNVFYIVRKFKN